MRELYIAGRRIADDTDAFVVAEIGCNHQGLIHKAEQLIQAASECGCDAVKLQKRDLEHWESLDPEAWHRPYNSEHAFGATYGEHRAALEFGWREYKHLKTFAEDRGLVFFATAFDVPSLRFLVELGVPAIKLASASIVDMELISACAATRTPTIMSTGGACSDGFTDEIGIAMEKYFMGWGGNLRDYPLAILQCTAEYPCEPRDMNLNVIPSLRRGYPETVIGLSDHYVGIALEPVAYALGARIIEKHFTLSRAAKGSDNAFSLEPVGMKKMVRDLRRTRVAMGDGIKRRLDGEIAPLIKMGRKDLVDIAITSVSREIDRRAGVAQ